jgi:hypothetical protein
MSGTRAATVQTLTAEVRTLVVGARRVTLSVAKQLDVVPLADLRVFGRVKIPTMPDIAVIGAAPDGTLALARRAPVNENLVPRISHAAAVATGIVVCQRLNAARYAMLSSDGVEFEICLDSVKRCGDWHYNTPQCDPAWRCGSREDALQIVAEVASQRTRWTSLTALNDAVRAAPLIVLAGLR